MDIAARDLIERRHENQILRYGAHHSGEPGIGRFDSSIKINNLKIANQRIEADREVRRNLKRNPPYFAKPDVQQARSPCVRRCVSDHATPSIPSIDSRPILSSNFGGPRSRTRCAP